MPKSDAVKIAEISARTQLTSQLVGIVTDPLYSTLAGFAIVHKMRKENMIGPVADDVLYAGIIAINTARTPALAQAVGSALGLENVLLPAAAGAVGAKVFGGAAAGAGGAAAGAAAGAARKSTLSRVAMGAAKIAVPVGLTALAAVEVDKVIQSKLRAKDRIAWRKVPLWKRLIPVIGQAAIRKAQREGEL